MEYPPETLPAVPPGGVTCGIDWANDDHAVCVVDMAGKVVQRFIAEHTGKGLAGLVRQLRRAGAGEVAIERPDGQVVGDAAGGRFHRGGDQPEPAEEPAGALRVGGQQG